MNYDENIFRIFSRVHKPLFNVIFKLNVEEGMKKKVSCPLFCMVLKLYHFESSAGLFRNVVKHKK